MQGVRLLSLVPTPQASPLCSDYSVVIYAGSEVSAVVCLDNKEVDTTKWAHSSNRAWEQQIKIDLHQVN